MNLLTSKKLLIAQEISLESLLEGSPKERLALTQEDREWIQEQPVGQVLIR